MSLNVLNLGLDLFLVKYLCWKFVFSKVPAELWML